MRSAVITILALTATTTSGAELPRKKWAQEPNSVLGVKLGVPLSASPVDVCPERGVRTGNWELPKEVCLAPATPYTDRTRGLEGLPWRDLRITGSVSLFQGKVESVYFELHHGDYQKFKEILITKYGPPAATESGEVTSQAGAVVGSETLQWVGETASIVLIERSGRIDRSAANVIHNAVAEEALAVRKAGIEDAASKL